MFGWFFRAKSTNVSNTEQDSKHWFLVCDTCGHKRSYWAVGGIRHKAAGTGKSIRTLCSRCGVKRCFETRWFDEADPEDAGKPHGWASPK